MKLRADYKHSSVIPLMHSERYNIGLVRYGVVGKTYTMKFEPEDLHSMISIQETAILNKSLFESARSIAETLLVTRTTVSHHLQGVH
jgi:hypothetical protein